MGIIQLINKLIKRVYISNATADDTTFQTVQVTYLGKTVNADLLMPYGIAANPPLDSPGIMLTIGAQDDNRVSMVGTSPAIRMKGLKDGEMAVGNFKKGNFVIFKESGAIELVCLEDLDLSISGDGNVTIEGDLNLTTIGDTKIESSGDLNLTTTGDTKIESSGDVDIESTAGDVTIQATTGDITANSLLGDVNVNAPAGDVSVTTTGTVDVTAANGVNLGIGGQPIARVGDSVNLLTGLIVSGSPNNTSN